MHATLKTVPAFSNLSTSELDSIAELAAPVEFSQTAEMPFQNSAGDHYFYVISKGHAKLSYIKHERHPVRICGPGDVLGYGEWYFEYEHKADCLDTLKAWRFLRQPFQTLLHATPNLQESMIKVLCEILSIKDDRISALENHSVSNRVAAVLLSFSDKFGKDTDGGRYIDVKVDRETMAKLAGTVTESLSRQLSDLEDSQIIVREGRSFLIKDLGKLEIKARQ